MVVNPETSLLLSVLFTKVSEMYNRNFQQEIKQETEKTDSRSTSTT